MLKDKIKIHRTYQSYIDAVQESVDGAWIYVKHVYIHEPYYPGYDSFRFQDGKIVHIRRIDAPAWRGAGRWILLCNESDSAVGKFSQDFKQHRLLCHISSQT